MQEQPHYSTTSNQGWSKMAPILDEAMPVNPRQRRFGFIWWAVSALLITGVIGLSIFKGITALVATAPTTTSGIETKENLDLKNDAAANLTSDQVDQNNANATIAIPQRSTNTTVESGMSQESEVRNVPTVKSEIGSSLKVEQNKLLNSKSKKSTDRAKQKKAVLPFAAIDAQEESRGPQGIGNIAELKNENMTNAQYPSSLAAAEKSTDEFASTIDRTVQIVSFIPILDVSYLDWSHRLWSDIQPGSIAKAKKVIPFLQPSLAIGGIIGQNGGLGSFASAGLQMNVGKRLGINTGIGYRSFQPEAELFGLSKDLSFNAESNAILNQDSNYEGIPTYISGEQVSAGVGYNAINPFVESVRQWQVSAGLNYKVTRRFFVEGGLQFGFATRVISEYPIISLDPMGSFTNARVSNSLNSYDVVRSTMTSLYGGLGYRFGKHLDLFANWTHGLDQYLLNEILTPSSEFGSVNRTDYIRGMTLGIRYTL